MSPNAMNRPGFSWDTFRRHLLGVFGLLLCLTAFILWWFYNADGSMQMYLSICLRAGLVLLAIWLAFPQAVAILSRYPPWVIGMTVICGFLLVVRPRLIIIIGPLIAAMLIVQFVTWVFKPPVKKTKK